jgi:hypothetical protein
MDARFQKKAAAQPELSAWDQMALNVMYANKGVDGTLGFIISRGPQSREWYRYFKSMGLDKKADFMAAQMRQNRQYMVPCEWPEQLDPSFEKSKDRFYKPKEMEPEDREEVVRRVYALIGMKPPEDRDARSTY